MSIEFQFEWETYAHNYYRLKIGRFCLGHVAKWGNSEYAKWCAAVYFSYSKRTVGSFDNVQEAKDALIFVCTQEIEPKIIEVYKKPARRSN